MLKKHQLILLHMRDSNRDISTYGNIMIFKDLKLLYHQLYQLIEFKLDI